MKLLQLIALGLALAAGPFAFAQDAPAPVDVHQKPVQLGFVGGVLSIPFKFHPQDHALTGGGALGGYVGWSTSWAGITLTPVITTGLSLSDAKYGTGFMVAGGLIGHLSNSPIQLGVIVGVDYYAKSLNYPYDGKPWIAAEIGYSFGR